MSTKKELEEKVKELEDELEKVKSSLSWRERANDNQYNEIKNVHELLTGFGIEKETDEDGYKSQLSILRRLSMLISLLLTKKGE